MIETATKNHGGKVPEQVLYEDGQGEAAGRSPGQTEGIRARSAFVEVSRSQNDAQNKSKLSVMGDFLFLRK